MVFSGCYWLLVQEHYQSIYKHMNITFLIIERTNLHFSLFPETFWGRIWIWLYFHSALRSCTKGLSCSCFLVDDSKGGLHLLIERKQKEEKDEQFSRFVCCRIGFWGKESDWICKFAFKYFTSFNFLLLDAFQILNLYTFSFCVAWIG